MCVHILRRSLKINESDAVDDVMSECTAALMQEQVDSLCDAEAGSHFFVFSCYRIL